MSDKVLTNQEHERMTQAELTEQMRQGHLAPDNTRTEPFDINPNAGHLPPAIFFESIWQTDTQQYSQDKHKVGNSRDPINLIAEAAKTIKEVKGIEEGDYTLGGALHEKHVKRIIGSAISWPIALLRGYRSINKKAEARRLGFSERQANVPAIVLPIYGVATGEIVNYQLRPDEAQVDRKTGKLRKYEIPIDSNMCIDVHPIVFRSRALRDARVPLFITEGVLKSDSALSKGLCCIALLGVWNWRGKNEYGGKTVLPDWEFISLQGRKVYIVFDSDVMEKESVYDALARIAAFLKTKSADISFIYLPPGNSGIKTGLDDFFFARSDMTRDIAVQELLQYATPELRERPISKRAQEEIPYKEADGGLIYYKETFSGVTPIKLTNFTAQIIKDTVEDDGAETKRMLTIKAQIGQAIHIFDINSARFTSMRWVLEYLGTNAVVYPGREDHARCAIQLLFKDDREYYKRFAHTGWRLIGDIWMYLHKGGAISAKGIDTSINVNLPGDLGQFILPKPPTGQQLKDAIKASMNMNRIGPHKIIYPLQAMIYRAPLGSSDFTFWLSGDSGAGKSVVGALAQSHFGPEFIGRNATANWSSTANALEALAHSAKDALFMVDDYAPTDRVTRDELNRKAERLCRAQGNQQGRQRMSADSTLRSTKHPRGSIISTGEDVPWGKSLRARLIIGLLDKQGPRAVFIRV